MHLYTYIYTYAYTPKKNKQTYVLKNNLFTNRNILTQRKRNIVTNLDQAKNTQPR